jgi:Tfp pilus assembly protein PilV
MQVSVRPARGTVFKKHEPRNRHFAGSKSAMTLVEVMVASVVLVLAIIGSLAALQKGFELQDTARNTTMADQILQSDLEDLRLCSWNTLPASGNLTLPAEVASKFTATRTVTTVRTDVKKVTVTVQWTDYKGRTHNRSYETLFTHFGLNDYFVVNRTNS